MEHLSSDMEQQNQHQENQQQVQWRRDKVQELCSKGYRTYCNNKRSMEYGT
jgi:hypothetical protein